MPAPFQNRISKAPPSHLPCLPSPQMPERSTRSKANPREERLRRREHVLQASHKAAPPAPSHPPQRETLMASVPEDSDGKASRVQMPPPCVRTNSMRAPVSGQLPATPAVLPVGGFQRPTIPLPGSLLPRCASSASSSSSGVRGSGSRAPTPATPQPGFNVYGLQPGDPCWYLGPGNAKTKAELLITNDAPIIGLEDLSGGLRSPHPAPPHPAPPRACPLASGRSDPIQPISALPTEPRIRRTVRLVAGRCTRSGPA